MAWYITLDNMTTESRALLTYWIRRGAGSEKADFIAKTSTGGPGGFTWVPPIGLFRRGLMSRPQLEPRCVFDSDNSLYLKTPVYLKTLPKLRITSYTVQLHAWAHNKLCPKYEHNHNPKENSTSRQLIGPRTYLPGILLEQLRGKCHFRLADLRNGSDRPPRVLGGGISQLNPLGNTKTRTETPT